MKVEKASTEAPPNFFTRNEELKRPMSPHLSIYQKQLTTMLSISHRFTGLALTGYITTLGFGALILPHDFSYYAAAIEGLQLSAPALAAIKFTLAFPLTYHTANGIRHLIWDSGKFLTLKDVYTTGYIMLFAAFVTAGALVAA